HDKRHATQSITVLFSNTTDDSSDSAHGFSLPLEVHQFRVEAVDHVRVDLFARGAIEPPARPGRGQRRPPPAGETFVYEEGKGASRRKQRSVGEQPVLPEEIPVADVL